MENAERIAENHILKGIMAQREAQIETLQFDLAQLRKLLFGARSERREHLPDPDQLPLWTQVPEDAPLATPITFKTVVESPAKRQPKRTELPKDLPREIVVLALSPEERACPECGSERPVIGYETSERLDYVPATLKGVETRRETCACEHCQGQLATVPAKPEVIKQGIPLPGLLAYLLTAKYGRPLPRHWIEPIFATQGLTLARATLCDWMMQWFCGCWSSSRPSR